MRKHLLKSFVILLLLINSNVLFGQIAIEINATFNNHEIEKDSWYSSENNDSIQIEKVQFYLTDFKLKTSENSIISIDESNFLIDVFNPETLKRKLKNTSIKDIKEISFNIGVTDSLHSIGALSGDLDPSKGMFWSWQSGYINFKIEGISPSCKTRKNKFQFHIGGYQNPYKTTKRVSFPTKNTSNKNIIINLNIADFFTNIDLKEENKILIPGKQAKQLADSLPKLFSIDE